MKAFAKRFYVALILLFLYTPIVLLIVYSFNASKSRAVWGGFTLDWYRELFQDRKIMAALQTTLSIGIIAAAVSTLIGTLAAIGLYQLRRGPRAALMALCNLPMLNSEIVTGVSLMLLYTAMNLELGYLTLLLSHVAFCIPYVILSVLPKLRQLDPHLAEAAQDLGATPLQAFCKVILPDIMPGVFSGFLMALTMSIDDFVISFFTTGMGVQNLSITIYTMAKRGISPKINALSTLIFLTVLLLLVIVNLPDFLDREKRDKKRRGMRTA
ncbi:ABC transporter permease subunit [Beduinella massiliensis]|uniref:ABC transporter permease subunit n=1 Tax=Beduinella massiliensis TaxID=1852363 RepID=UPI000C8589B1